MPEAGPAIFAIDQAKNDAHGTNSVVDYPRRIAALCFRPISSADEFDFRKREIGFCSCFPGKRAAGRAGAGTTCQGQFSLKNERKAPFWPVEATPPLRSFRRVARGVEAFRSSRTADWSCCNIAGGDRPAEGIDRRKIKGQTMRLIGMLDSPYVRRVAISLRLMELPFSHEALSVFRNFEAFAAINSVVKAPTFVTDDGVVLMDSALILEYLERLVAS